MFQVSRQWKEHRLHLLSALDLPRCRCRPFVRACLFQPGESARVASLVRLAEADPARAGLLQEAAPLETALQAAQALDWDR